MISTALKVARNAVIPEAVTQQGTGDDLKPVHKLRPQRNFENKVNCAHDFTKAVSLLALCVGLIVKGVSYDNSHWANQDELDVVNNKDHFPIMTSFIDNIKSGKHENCEDPKCRIFFDKYAALQTLATTRGGSGSSSVPLRGTVSRGVNRRCERVALMPSSETPLGSSSISKYEKCTIDKQTEVNEFKTIRYLLVASMICDAIGLLNWIAVLSYSGQPSSSSLARLFLVSSALCGFIAALLTALGLGLFAQAVDVFENPFLYLGWPFYAVFASTFLSIITAITSSARLQKASIQYGTSCSSRRKTLSPAISIIDMTAEEFEAAYPFGCNVLPPGYRTISNNPAGPTAPAIIFAQHRSANIRTTPTAPGLDGSNLETDESSNNDSEYRTPQRFKDDAFRRV